MTISISTGEMFSSCPASTSGILVIGADTESSGSGYPQDHCRGLCAPDPLKFLLQLPQGTWVVLASDPRALSHTNTPRLLLEPQPLGKTFRKFPVAATNCSGLRRSKVVTCLSPPWRSQLLKLAKVPWPCRLCFVEVKGEDQASNPVW